MANTFVNPVFWRFDSAPAMPPPTTLDYLVGFTGATGQCGLFAIEDLFFIGVNAAPTASFGLGASHQLVVYGKLTLAAGVVVTIGSGSLLKVI